MAIVKDGIEVKEEYVYVGNAVAHRRSKSMGFSVSTILSEGAGIEEGDMVDVYVRKLGVKGVKRRPSNDE